MLSLAVILAFAPTTAPPAIATEPLGPAVRLCIAEPAGMRTSAGQRLPDGSIVWFDSGRESAFVPAQHPTARGRPWFEARRTITVGAVTYRRAGAHQVTWPFRRYNRRAGSFDGLPLFSPLGAEGRILLAPTDPVECWFERYEAVPTRSRPGESAPR